MTVADIKQEYALVLATLELARQFPEIIEQSKWIVNLYTQLISSRCPTKPR